MKVALYTDEELQRFANDIKEIVLAALEREGLIVDAETVAAEYAVIVYRPGWLGRLFDKLRPGAGDEPLRATVLKTLSTPREKR
jgi:hypothetical protein